MSGRLYDHARPGRAPGFSLYQGQRGQAAPPRAALPQIPAVIPLGSPAAHNFANVRVHTDSPRTASPQRPQVAHLGGARIQDAGPDAGPSPTPTPTPTPTPAGDGGAPANPTLSLSNNSYTDSGNTSHKRIKFNVAVPSGLTATDYALVNKVQGHMKKADGTFHKAVLYGSLVDINFPTERVDSVDADPVYWSSSSGRWNYTTVSGGFNATDDPGPPGYTFAPGDEAALKFKIGLYRLASVPTTTTGTISVSPIQELPWQYSVKAAADGTLSHPSL